MTIYLPSDSDIYTWEALIDGPKDSLYAGILLLQMQIATW